MGAVTWTERERELLGVTLSLLQQNGYDGLTVDDVAAEGRASKATMYRRWPTKAELVLAAVMEGVGQVSVAPETGSLRTDLIEVGDKISKQARAHATTMRAVLVEASRNSALNDFMQQQMFAQRKKLISHVLQQAIDRGEIKAEAVNDDLWDLLPGYLVFRAVIQDRPATRRAVEALVDEVIIPGLTRDTSP
ncbi:MAG: TetR/AcrR family transcriptional regulator [Mycobacterium sp.]